MDTTTILDCGHAPSPHGDHTTGYGETPDGKRICWDCCAERDRQEMRSSGRITLYLTIDKENIQRGTVTNWPGTLAIPCRFRQGLHNIARTRYDVWFQFEGDIWHGVQFGDWTQICHCRRTKRRA